MTFFRIDMHLEDLYVLFPHPIPVGCGTAIRGRQSLNAPFHLAIASVCKFPLKGKSSIKSRMDDPLLAIG